MDTHAADTWTAQPDWLDNETLRHTVTATPQGLRFSVPEGLQGMKWSHLLREALAGTRYAVMRYRARNLRGWGEYVLYAASTGPALLKHT